LTSVIPSEAEKSIKKAREAAQHSMLKVERSMLKVERSMFDVS